MSPTPLLNYALLMAFTVVVANLEQFVCWAFCVVFSSHYCSTFKHITSPPLHYQQNTRTCSQSILLNTRILYTPSELLIYLTLHCSS